MTRRPAAVALVAGIAASALLLRGWRLAWGLDEGLFFLDEYMWLVRCAGFVPLSWQSFAVDMSHFYPALYGYLDGLATAAANALGLLRADRRELDMILVARAVGAAASAANVALVGILGARLYGIGVGLAAAALMAVVPYEAVQVHYASVDALLSVCFTLTLLAGVALERRGTLARAALAGAAAGLAFATKYTGLAALGVLGVPLLERAREEGWRRALWLGTAVLAGFALGVSVACPPCVLDAGTMLIGMQKLATLDASGYFPNHRLVPSLGWYGHRYLYQLVAGLPYGLGWPLYALALVGVAVALRRREPADRVLLGAFATGLLAGGFPSLVFVRYLMPIFPVLVILAARAALAVPRRVGVAALVVSWAYTAALAASQVATISFTQQREVAQWIAARTGTGARVAITREFAEYFLVHPFLVRAGLVPVAAPSGQWLEAQADVIVLADWQEIAILRDFPADAPEARELALLRSGAAGYREAARWRTWFLQRDLYARLDPGLQIGLGSYGFAVYVRTPPG